MFFQPIQIALRSDTFVGVQPNRVAQKPKAIAPYKPAIGPTPEATPNAKASGSAITAAVTPPKRSPLRVFMDAFIKEIFGSWFLFVAFLRGILVFVYRRVFPDVAAGGDPPSIPDSGAVSEA